MWIGAGEQHGTAGDQSLVGDILRQRRLADAIGSDQDDVAGVLKEVERHQRVDGGAVAALGPGPVEVASCKGTLRMTRLEAADTRILQSPFQAAGICSSRRLCRAGLGGLIGESLERQAVCLMRVSR